MESSQDEDSRLYEKETMKQMSDRVIKLRRPPRFEKMVDQSEEHSPAPSPSFPISSDLGQGVEAVLHQADSMDIVVILVCFPPNFEMSGTTLKKKDSIDAGYSTCSTDSDETVEEWFEDLEDEELLGLEFLPDDQASMRNDEYGRAVSPSH